MKFFENEPETAEAVPEAVTPEAPAPKDERVFSPQELETYLERIKADLRAAKREGDEDKVAELETKFADLKSRLQ